MIEINTDVFLLLFAVKLRQMKAKNLLRMAMFGVLRPLLLSQRQDSGEYSTYKPLRERWDIFLETIPLL